jgi:hypothetical protein
MEWSKKAWFVLIVYIITALILSGVTIRDPEAGYSAAIIAFIVLILSVALVAFDVNCF